jgi:hypothetical protein
VNLLADSSEQGRFFGILDGGRGLVEALLASVAVLLFRGLSGPGDAATLRLAPVIYMYSFAALAFALLVFLFVEDNAGADSTRGTAARCSPTCACWRASRSCGCSRSS